MTRVTPLLAVFGGACGSYALITSTDPVQTALGWVAVVGGALGLLLHALRDEHSNRGPRR